MSSYVPLWCKSNFSFLEGASHPDELIEEAHRLGLQSLALTDRDGVYGIVRAHVKAREVGLHLIVGSEITVTDGSTILLLAQDRAGYANLCRLITTGRLRSSKGESAVTWDEICRHASGLIALWGGGRSLIVGENDCDEAAGKLRDAFGDRNYAMVARHRREEEAAQEKRLRRRATAFLLPRQLKSSTTRPPAGRFKMSSPPSATASSCGRWTRKRAAGRARSAPSPRPAWFL
jgi:error-prone DNA polymerase